MSKKRWDFFDHFGEIVYVSDMDTNELVYLNQAGMEKHGFCSQEDFKGKKCHEVLLRCAQPCAICNNAVLRHGEFIKGEFYNPVLKEYMLYFDTMIFEDGKPYHLSIAINTTAQKRYTEADISERQRNMEAMVNSVVRTALHKPTPDETIEYLLEYIGLMLDGERACIFEKLETGEAENTYEWVAAGVTPKKERRRRLSAEEWEKWHRMFLQKQYIVLQDANDEMGYLQFGNLEDTNIHSLIALPLYNGAEIIGFFGVGNLKEKSLIYGVSLLHIMGNFIVAAIKRRNVMQELEEMSFLDPMTKLGNRNAMERYEEKIRQCKQSGIVYCDVTGLKRVNDTQGHQAGDRLIFSAAKSMQSVFGECGLFRIGGDEFLIICPEITEVALREKIMLLRKAAQENDVILAIGSSWKAGDSISIGKMVVEAENEMYRDKSLYYQRSGIDRRRR